MRVFLECITLLLLFTVIGASIYTIYAKLTAPDIVIVDDMPRPSAVAVKPGDTLWGIAREYYPGMHTGQMVELIRQANPGVDPGALQIGQRVVLPEVEQ